MESNDELKDVLKYMFIGVILMTIFLLSLNYYNNRQLYNENNPTNIKTLKTAHNKYVVRKETPVKFIKYDETTDYFVWKRTKPLVKVEYPDNLVKSYDIPKYQTFNLHNIPVEYRFTNKNHPKESTELIFQYEAFKPNTPKQIKYALLDARNNFFPSEYVNTKPDNVYFVIYKNSQ